jgi:hypothetical protein
LRPLALLLLFPFEFELRHHRQCPAHGSLGRSSGVADPTLPEPLID